MITYFARKYFADEKLAPVEEKENIAEYVIKYIVNKCSWGNEFCKRSFGINKEEFVKKMHADAEFKSNIEHLCKDLNRDLQFYIVKGPGILARKDGKVEYLDLNKREYLIDIGDNRRNLVKEENTFKPSLDDLYELLDYIREHCIKGNAKTDLKSYEDFDTDFDEVEEPENSNSKFNIADISKLFKNLEGVLHKNEQPEVLSYEEDIQKNFSRIVHKHFAALKECPSITINFLISLWNNYPWMIKNLFKEGHFDAKRFQTELQRISQFKRYDSDTIAGELIENLSPVMKLFHQDGKDSFYVDSKKNPERIIINFIAKKPITVITPQLTREFTFEDAPFFTVNGNGTRSLSNILFLIWWMELICEDEGYEIVSTLHQALDEVRQLLIDYRTGKITREDFPDWQKEIDSEINPEVYWDLMRGIDKMLPNGGGWT